eukprot:gene339-biopygen143
MLPTRHRQHSRKRSSVPPCLGGCVMLQCFPFAEVDGTDVVAAWLYPRQVHGVSVGATCKTQLVPQHSTLLHNGLLFTKTIYRPVNEFSFVDCCKCRRFFLADGRHAHPAGLHTINWLPSLIGKYLPSYLPWQGPVRGGRATANGTDETPPTPGGDGCQGRSATAERDELRNLYLLLATPGWHPDGIRVLRARDIGYAVRLASERNGANKGQDPRAQSGAAPGRGAGRILMRSPWRISAVADRPWQPSPRCWGCLVCAVGRCAAAAYRASGDGRQPRLGILQALDNVFLLDVLIFTFSNHELRDSHGISFTDAFIASFSFVGLVDEQHIIGRAVLACILGISATKTYAILAPSVAEKRVHQIMTQYSHRAVFVWKRSSGVRVLRGLPRSSQGMHSFIDMRVVVVVGVLFACVSAFTPAASAEHALLVRCGFESDRHRWTVDGVGNLDGRWMEKPTKRDHQNPHVSAGGAPLPAARFGSLWAPLRGVANKFPTILEACHGAKQRDSEGCYGSRNTTGRRTWEPPSHRMRSYSGHGWHDEAFESADVRAFVSISRPFWQYV